jgi:inosose dehydratase
MAGFALATGPVSWGVDFADAPGNPPWPLVLDEIASSGIGALELGPVGYLPEDPGALRDALRRRGLVAVGSFVFEAFHDGARAAAIEALTVRASRAVAAAGGAVIVLIDRPGAERAATAGRSQAARRLDRGRWSVLVGGLRRAAAVADAHGLRAVVHPHAGGFLEFDDEIERLLQDSDLDLCVDTGHAAYAGIAAERLIERCGERLGHVHLKDLRGDVLARVRAERLDFWDAIGEGVFCPLGEGDVDLPAVLGALDAAGYAGYATIEQDRVAGCGSPLADLAASRRVLASAGLAEAAR